MKVVGGDLYAKQQTIATVDTDTDRLLERTLVQEWNAVARVLRCLRGADGGRHRSHRIEDSRVYEDRENEYCYHLCQW